MIPIKEVDLMKKFIAFLLLVSVVVCAWTSGCDILETQKNIHEAEEQLLRAIVENEDLQNWIANHPLDSVAADAKTNLIKAFPSLEKLMSYEGIHEFLRTRGIEMTQEYLVSADPAAQKRAETLGAIIQILYPDLTDEVDAIFNK